MIQNDIKFALDKVFQREVTNSEFLEEASRILKIQDGQPYPKFVWKADHYLTDADLCIEDPEYEEMMREDIWALYRAYFEENNKEDR